MAGTGSKVSTHRPERPSTPPTTDEIHRRIAEAAYYRAQQRGFRGVDPADDWLQAEHEPIGQSSDASERV